MKKLLATALVLTGSAMILSAADCDPKLFRIEGSNGQLRFVNTSSKPIVGYVVTGSPSRTYSGVFTEGDSLKINSSIALDKSGNPAEFTIDYLRFADGAACGAKTTEQAKEVAARFGSKP